MLELEELELLLLLKQRAGSVAHGDTHYQPKIEAYHPEPKPPAVSGVLTLMLLEKYACMQYMVDMHGSLNLFGCTKARITFRLLTWTFRHW